MEYECLIIPEPGKALQLVKRPLPDVPSKGAIVEVHVAGLCHSDFHVWEGYYQLGKGKRISFAERPGYSYPIVPGHEVAGKVLALGDGYESDESYTLAVGDFVAVYSFIGCGECLTCLAGKDNNCGRALQRGIGFQLDGGLASHLVVPDAKYLLKVPSGVDLRWAALATCSGITAQNAVTISMATVKEAIAVEGQARVLIIGAGGLGLWAVQLAKTLLGTLGSVRVVAADIREEKLADALACGADDTVLWVESKTTNGYQTEKKPSPSHVAGLLPGSTSTMANEKSILAEKAKQALGGLPNVILDFVGSTKTAGTALACLSQGGLLVLIGLFGGSLDLELPLMALRNHSIVGIHAGTHDDLDRLLQLLSEKRITVPKYEEFFWHDANTALQKMKDGTLSGRAVLQMIK